MGLGRSESRAGVGAGVVPVVINRRVGALTHCYTTRKVLSPEAFHKHPYTGRCSKLPFTAGKDQVLSLCLHLLLIRRGHSLNCTSGFSCFCLTHRPCLPPRVWSGVVARCSDHAGCCPKGQQRTRTAVPGNEGQSLCLALDFVQLGQGVHGPGGLSSQVPCSTKERPSFGRKKNKICDARSF